MGAEETLKIHHWLAESYANGPGRRAVVWVQGCSLGCLGCFNPETHPTRAGEAVRVDELARNIAALGNRIQGLTISGGEPFQQPEALAELCRQIRQRTDLSIVIFSGFELEEIRKIPASTYILENCDVLLCGRYQQERHVGRGLLGSDNKEMIFLTNQYRAEDFESLPEAEVVIGVDGEILLSGIDPLKFQNNDGSKPLNAEHKLV